MWHTSLSRCRDPGSQRPTHTRQRTPLRRAPCRLLVEQLEGRTVPSTVTTPLDVVDPNDGVLSLREAIQDANTTPGADMISFAPQVRGMITLDRNLGQLNITDALTIDGPGANRLAVSGGDATRVFDISPGAKVTISGMTITRGLADGHAPVLPSTGGGILNFGELTLSHVVVSDNRAIGDINANPLGRGPGNAAGGGVYNGGTLTVEDHSIFTRNQVLGKGPDNLTSTSTRFPGVAGGGGLANEGVATVTDSQFTSNLAQGGNFWQGPIFAGIGGGGAIASLGFVHAQLVVSGSNFTNNRAIGGDYNLSGRLPGYGIGGAIFNNRFGNGAADLNVSDSTFDHNQAIGGNFNQGAPGGSLPVPNIGNAGGIFINNGTAVTISGSTFEHNQAIGGQGLDNNGGEGHGGGIGVAFPGTIVTVTDCRVEHNMAIGGQAGPGGTGGNGRGGGISNNLGARLTVTDNSIIDHNQALGGSADTSGPASKGGIALGGGLDNDALSMVNVTASTISYNLAIGAAGANGGNGGDGLGGGFYNAGTANLTESTFTHNLAIGGEAGSGGATGLGEGGGLYLAPGGTARLDSFTQFHVTDNHASTSDDDIFGTFTPYP
jgi:hypothetical protein